MWKTGLGFFLRHLSALSRYYELGRVQSRSRYALASAYHTIFAMGLLCAAILNDENLPGSVIRTSTKGCRWRGSARSVLRLLETGGGVAHWQQYVAGLEDGQQDAIAPLLLALHFDELPPAATSVRSGGPPGGQFTRTIDDRARATGR